MGEVYRAKDSKLRRDVAIKVLPESLAADADALARFEREALAVAALSHPNILSIFDFGTQDGISYAVTELLEGETLRGKLDAGRISQKQVVDYAIQVARGLSAAHEKGIVHRDLKPGASRHERRTPEDSRLRLSKRTEPGGADDETSAPTESRRTESGVVMGTVAYMSPEQVRGLPVDHRSDIFSFGAVLYEMLWGKRAFKRDTPVDTMSAILKEEPPELAEARRNISPALDRIVRHCLERLGTIGSSPQGISSSLSRRHHQTRQARLRRPPPSQPALAPAGSSRSGPGSDRPRDPRDQRRQDPQASSGRDVPVASSRSRSCRSRISPGTSNRSTSPTV